MELWAHRGANWHCLENTLPAFRRALQDGATALEMDVHRTKDDVMVVCHDPVWRHKKIAKTRYEGLSELSTLEEVLLAFPNVKLNIDIKPKDLRAVYLTVGLVEKYGASSRVCLTSFSLEVHRWLDDLRYAGERGMSAFEVALVWLLPVSILQFASWFGRRAQVPLRWGVLRLDTEYFVRKCHRLGLLVDYWVVNEPIVASRLIELGADGIMTDDPASLASV